MAIAIGLGIGLGRRFVGVDPNAAVNSPSVVLASSLSIVASPSVVVDPRGPLAIVQSKAAQLFFSADDAGITIGTGVSLWPDRSGNGRDLVQATSGLQPARATNQLNGKAIVQFTAHALANTWLPPAPGTTPTFFWGVLRPVTIVNGNVIHASGSARFKLGQSTTNRLQISNTTGGGLVTAVPNTWYRTRELFGNATADYLKMGSIAAGTGVATGNNPGVTGFFLGAASATGTTPAVVDVACFAAWNGEPSAGELSALDAWATAYYGGGVQV